MLTAKQLLELAAVMNKPLLRASIFAEENIKLEREKELIEFAATLRTLKNSRRRMRRRMPGSKCMPYASGWGSPLIKIAPG